MTSRYVVNAAIAAPTAKMASQRRVLPFPSGLAGLWTRLRRTRRSPLPPELESRELGTSPASLARGTR